MKESPPDRVPFIVLLVVLVIAVFVLLMSDKVRGQDYGPYYTAGGTLYERSPLPSFVENR